MKNLSLSTKFHGILFILVGCIMAVAVLGISKMTDFHAAIDSIITKNVPRVVIAKSLDAITNEIKNQEKGLILEQNAEEIAKIISKMDELDAEARALLSDLNRIVLEVSRANITEATKYLDSWHTANLEVRRLAKLNLDTEAFTVSKNAGRDFLDKFDGQMDIIIKRNVDILDAERKNTDKLYEDSKFMMMALTAVAVILGLLLASLILRALNKSINRVIEGLNESSIQLTSAALQIAASSQELSQGATEQASSLEETSSAVEEMNSMVQKNAESAQETLKSSQSSGDSAARGKKVVEEMKRAMKEIDAANVNIMIQTNDSNLKISEIVKVIAEIGNKTKVINDIVFQTKLLSFNASVEAARAGEHGKGFAVVAEEVGNLAQMSGNAAKEISSMLDSSIEKVESIVKFTKTSVEKLVAESKSKVELGSKVAAECETVLNEIVGKVTVVYQMSHSISTASDEQARGISEINKAVAQLDQMTQQNAAVSEEAASAAEELSSQAESMQSMVQTLILTIRGGDPSHKAPEQPIREIAPLRKATLSNPKFKSGNVVHLGAKKPIARSHAAVPTLKMVSGGDVAPSEDDPRFKDI